MNFRKILYSIFIMSFTSLIAAPEISVIVPVYNTENFLRDCIDSILNQSFKNFELICINDGSKDKSGLILDGYAKKDSRVIILTQKNSGAATARNSGLSIAKGKYIVFVDSDDTIHNDMLKIMQNIIETYQCDMAICAVNRDILRANNGNFDSNSIQLFYNYPQKPIYNCLYQLCCNKIHRKSSIQHLRFIDGMVFCEDMHFNLLALARANKYAFVPCILYNYRNNENSVTGKRNTYSLKNIDDFILSIESVYHQTSINKISRKELQSNVLNDMAIYMLEYSYWPIKTFLYASQKIALLYDKNIISTNTDCFFRKLQLITSISIGKIMNFIFNNSH